MRRLQLRLLRSEKEPAGIVDPNLDINIHYKLGCTKYAIVTDTD